MHTLSESKSIFAIEQKAIVSCFVKKCCVFIGTLCIRQLIPKLAFNWLTNVKVIGFAFLCHLSLFHVYLTNDLQCQFSVFNVNFERNSRELKQTDAAAVNRQISIQIQSDGCQGPTEFTWP